MAICFSIHSYRSSSRHLYVVTLGLMCLLLHSDSRGRIRWCMILWLASYQFPSFSLTCSNQGQNVRHHQSIWWSKIIQIKHCSHCVMSFHKIFMTAWAIRFSIHWRHNERLKWQASRFVTQVFFFRRRSKEISKVRATGLSTGNSPVTGEFPAQMSSNAENVSIWWRHHVRCICRGMFPFLSSIHHTLLNHYACVVKQNSARIYCSMEITS